MGIEPLKTKLVQGVYFRWMAEIKIKKMTELYTTHVLLHKMKILLASIAIETSYPAKVEVNVS